MVETSHPIIYYQELDDATLSVLRTYDKFFLNALHYAVLNKYMNDTETNARRRTCAHLYAIRTHACIYTCILQCAFTNTATVALLLDKKADLHVLSVCLYNRACGY